MYLLLTINYHYYYRYFRKLKLQHFVIALISIAFFPRFPLPLLSIPLFPFYYFHCCFQFPLFIASISCGGKLIDLCLCRFLNLNGDMPIPLPSLSSRITIAFTFIIMLLYLLSLLSSLSHYYHYYYYSCCYLHYSYRHY